MCIENKQRNDIDDMPLTISRVYKIFTLLLMLPFVLCGSCDKKSAPTKGKASAIVSPSGKYTLAVPIEQNSEYYNRPVWKVAIRDKKGKLLFKDDDSTFIGTLSVYFTWDDQDRVWLYNSDNGCVYFYEQIDANWKKQEWGQKRQRTIERNISPPKSLRRNLGKSGGGNRGTPY